MTSRRLSQADKTAIIELYRQSGETTSTLASRYGVSTSTISRLLKNHFSEAEYDALIQQKRHLRSSQEVSSTEATTLDSLEASGADVVQLSLADDEPDANAPQPPERRSRKRSSAQEVSALPEVAPLTEAETLPLSSIEEPAIAKPKPVINGSAPILKRAKSAAEVESEVDGLLDEEFLDPDGDLEEDDLEDDFDSEEEFDDDLEEDDLEDGALLVPGVLQGKAWVQVLPISEAPLPRTCYLVVDRSAELIARPLKDFGDLGQIPEEEVQEKTLPVFDNHRVAKRFSNPRTHRIIKLPDGKMLERTTAHLQAKGITRLLIDGQVYAL